MELYKRYSLISNLLRTPNSCHHCGSKSDPFKKSLKLALFCYFSLCQIVSFENTTLHPIALTLLLRTGPKRGRALVLRGICRIGLQQRLPCGPKGPAGNERRLREHFRPIRESTLLYGRIGGVYQRRPEHAKWIRAVRKQFELPVCDHRSETGEPDHLLYLHGGQCRKVQRYRYKPRA